MSRPLTKDSSACWLRLSSTGAIGGGPIESHIAHALGFAVAWPTLGDSEWVLDLGSGGGLPGLVLAVHFPATRFVLLDGRAERARLLGEEVTRLGLDSRVEVVGERAELAARRPEWRGRFDTVVARSFGAPAVTAECGAGFLVVGGALVVSDPPGADPNRWPPGPLAELGLTHARSTANPFAFAVLRQVTACPDRYPRRVGIPAKRPIF